VLSADAYQRQQHTGESLLEFLQRSPLADAAAPRSATCDSSC